MSNFVSPNHSNVINGFKWNSAKKVRYGLRKNTYVGFWLQCRFFCDSRSIIQYSLPLRDKSCIVIWLHSPGGNTIFYGGLRSVITSTFITRESRMLRASLPSSVHLSVTVVICIKTVQARITKSTLWAAPRSLVYRDKISCHWVQGFLSNEGVKEGYPLYGAWGTESSKLTSYDRRPANHDNGHGMSKKTSFCRYWLE